MKRLNEELAARSLSAAQDRGVREWVVCPGARNGTWIEALKTGAFGQVYWHFEERAAAFFALGRARSTGRPVAVLTTSGTAVGEMLPAAMEAHHSGTPLVLMSADRPRRYRGTGAPQSCIQPGIFSHFVDASLDWHHDSTDEELEIRQVPMELMGPVHFNVCFEDPRRPVNETASIEELGPQSLRAPLVIVGELSIEESRAVREWLLACGFPVITESLSQLREDPALDSIRVLAHRGVWEEARLAGYEVSCVIRIGGIPTHRIWRDLEGGAGAPKTVLSLNRVPFSGTVGGHIKRVDLRAPASWDLDLEPMTRPARASVIAWVRSQEPRRASLDLALRIESWSEPAIFRWLSGVIEPETEIYLGNSSPIREWDLAASNSPRSGKIHASRGLNGIDGQVSTFLGSLRDGVKSCGIFGDLTMLYDPSAPWILRQLATDPQWRLIVINNHGGRIFERMFPAREFLNEHEMGFEAWARHWGLSYQRLLTAEALRSQVVEIIPNAESTGRFWSQGTWD